MAKLQSIGLADLHMQAKITNKLLAAQLKERLQQNELILLLMTTGATDQEIADVLGTTAATVSVTKGRIKKKAMRPKAAAPSEDE